MKTKTSKADALADLGADVASGAITEAEAVRMVDGAKPETANHTPLPWHYDGSVGMVYAENGLRVADPGCDGQEEEMSEEEEEANGEFIVHACNNHEALLDSLKMLHDAVQELSGQWTETVANMMQQAEAAIEKAERR